MAKLILELTNDNGEVIEEKRRVEVSLPGDTNNEAYAHSVGFTIRDEGENTGTFTLSVEGMDQLVEFYKENRDKIRGKKKFFGLGEKE